MLTILFDQEPQGIVTSYEFPAKWKA